MQKPISHTERDYVPLPEPVDYSALSHAYALATWSWWDDEKNALVFPDADALKRRLVHLVERTDKSNRVQTGGGMRSQLVKDKITIHIHKELNEHYRPGKAEAA